MPSPPSPPSPTPTERLTRQTEDPLVSTKTLSIVLCMATLSAAMLNACGRGAVAQADPPRAVKLETCGRDARAQSRFVAAVRQEQRADLAFENGGRIATVLVDVGD